MQTLAMASSQIVPKTATERVPFDMDVCFISDKDRRTETEAFIKAGYKKAFNAEISVTMPALLYIEDDNLKAALGLRGSGEPFFVEQYLDQPLISFINRNYPEAITEDVVEIGSLYSNTSRFTIPLFLVTAAASALLNKKFLVLCGTEHVLALLTKSGVTYHEILKADPSKLIPSTDDWGDYYQTNPHVVYADLNEVMALIHGNKFYEKLFYRLKDKIDNACYKMAGKL